MRSEVAFVGARGVDSYPFSRGGTATQAKRLKASGIDFLVGYLGGSNMNAQRLDHVLSAGLAFMPVTLAGEYFDGAGDEIADLRGLRIPTGATVWLDLEGDKSYRWPPSDLIRLVNAWAGAIKAAGYIAGLYVGSPQPLTGLELARLAVTRYWKAPSLVLDRTGRDWSEPSGIGWCMLQAWPSKDWPSPADPDRVWVDVNLVQEDRRGRLPTWVVR